MMLFLTFKKKGEEIKEKLQDLIAKQKEAKASKAEEDDDDDDESEDEE